MDEDNQINQEPLEKQKLGQLEDELGKIGNNAAQEVSPQPNQHVQQPDTPQPIPPVLSKDPKPQGLGRSKGILWIGVVLLALALVGAGAYYLGSRRTAPTTNLESTPTQTPTPSPDPTANWKTYNNKKFGFSLKYPAELNVEAKEIDIKADQRKYKKDCETGVYEGCGGGRWPEYQISFMRSNGKSAFDVVIFVVSASDFFGGKENGGFTYVVRISGLVGQSTEYEPVETGFASKIEETIEFISPDGPIVCLWTDEFVGVDINEPGMIESLYTKALGYFYSQKEDSCQATEVFVIVREGLTAQEEANIPFQTIGECIEICDNK